MILRSPYPAVDVPELSFTRFVAGAGVDPERVAFIDGPTGERTTHGALWERVARVANGLVAAGLRRGDRVALFGPATTTWVVGFHAVIAAGGVATPINPLAGEAELAHDLALADPRFVLCAPELLPKLAPLCRGRVLFALGRDEPTGACTLPDVDIDPRRDLAVLPFSSGTTGRSKGVMLTHHNLVAQLCSLSGVTNSVVMAPGDVAIAVLPLFHIYGIVAFLGQALRLGGTVVLMPRFDLAAYLGLVEQHRATRLHVVPPIALALARHPLVDRHDLSRVEAVLCAAAPLGEEVAQAITLRLHVPVAQAYGMTELSGASHLGPLSGPRHAPASAGVLMPLCEAKLVDVETGAELDAGARGELCVRGPIVMRGYLGDDAATQRTIDAEGWLHTGDVAYVDEREVLHVVDRVKELIKYKGLQVAPAELEDVLLRHPAVADVAVVGVPDDEAGEIPKAFVVRGAGSDIDEAALIAFVAERVSPQKRVRQVAFVDAIPRSAAGKILRRLLS